MNLVNFLPMNMFFFKFFVSFLYETRICCESNDFVLHFVMIIFLLVESLHK